MSVKMTALRDLTASQSTTGKQVERGGGYTVPEDNTAKDHERRGMGKAVDAKAAGNKAKE